MKYCIITFLFLLLNAPYTSHAGQWSPWAKLDDGALNGIEFSHKNDCPPGGNVTCNHSWRFSSGYETSVTVEYTIAWDTPSGIQKKTARTTLKPGENRDDSFTVTGTALDEVTVRLIADQKVLAAARQEVAAEQRRQEEERRRQEEAARKAEQARIAAEQRQKRLAMLAALAYQPGEPAEVTAYRDAQRRREEEARRRAEEARQAELDRQRREQEAREEEQRAEQERQERRERREAERAEQARQDREDTRRIWMNGMQGIQQSLNQAQQTYNNSVQQGIDAQNALRRERERQAREAEDNARRQRQAEADQRRQADRDRAEESRRQREQEQERVRVAQAETERQERARRQQAEEQERRRAEQAERERKKAEDEAKWQVEDFTATRWGCDELYRKSNGVVATLTNSKGEVVLGESRYVRIFNPDNKYSIQYTVANSSYRDRTLGPGREVIVPLNLPANVKEVNEAVVRVRYHAGE